MKDRNNCMLAKTRLIRLIYYNDFLLKQGTLTNREHQKMNNAIISKYGKASFEKKDNFSYQKSLSSAENK